MVTFENPFILHLKTPKPYQTGCDVRLADVQTTGGRKELEQLRNVVLVGFFCFGGGGGQGSECR